MILRSEFENPKEIKRGYSSLVSESLGVSIRDLGLSEKPRDPLFLVES